MPALTKSRLGSSSSSDAEGTAVCPAASKCARNRARMSAVLRPLLISPTSRCLSRCRTVRSQVGLRRLVPGAGLPRPAIRSRRSASASVRPWWNSSRSIRAPTDRRAGPVAHAVGGERLRDAPGLHHAVDAGRGSGREPEAAPHQGSASVHRDPSDAGIEARCRASHSRRASFTSTLRCLRDRFTSRFISKRIRLRTSGASARRRPAAIEAVRIRLSPQHHVDELGTGDGRHQGRAVRRRAARRAR